jgi:putative DNA primase/helicase
VVNIANLYSKEAPTKKVVLTKAADIPPEKIDWVWKGYIAKSKLQLLAGTPKTGKTMLALSFAAIISNGGKWPDGTQADLGNVLFWSGEDTMADVIIPRLIAADADLNRIHIISAIAEGEKKRSFDPSTDLPALEEAMATIGDVSLVIIDPFVSALEKTKNSHNNAETRQGLQPVHDFIAKTKCAMIGIHHLTKGTQGRDPMDRITGSLAFTAVARIILMAAKNSDEDGGSGAPNVFVRAGGNIGKEGCGFGYRIEEVVPVGVDDPIEAPRVKWLEPLEGDARRLIQEAETLADDSNNASKLALASIFLNNYLADGPKPMREIKSKAEAAGHKWRTIKDAKNTLKIISNKAPTANGGWIWELNENSF